MTSAIGDLASTYCSGYGYRPASLMPLALWVVDHGFAVPILIASDRVGCPMSG